MKYCNLDYLKSITPNNNTFAIQIIKLFLNDTPIAIDAIKKNNNLSNWNEVYSNVHRIKPSFSMIGIPQDVIDVLLKINEISISNHGTEHLSELIISLEKSLVLIYTDLTNQLKEMEN